MNCTGYDNTLFCKVRDVFIENNLPLLIDKYRSDDDLLSYLRSRKIQKIKTTMLI